jgi:hypothetical protein
LKNERKKSMDIQVDASRTHSEGVGDQGEIGSIHNVKSAENVKTKMSRITLAMSYYL